MNDRLGLVEKKVDSTTVQRQDRKGKQPKLSRTVLNFHNNNVTSSDSESSEDEGQAMPSLSTIRSKKSIQKQIDSRIRELEAGENVEGTDAHDKIKSKRGGPIDVYVKKKVAWPHEAILGGINRTRLTYDQLSMAQWVQGFCRNIIDEKDEAIREKMVTYMGDLMEDATDFAWQGAKAAHAVLLCEIERGVVSWQDTNRIERIRRAHAQKHVGNWQKNGTKSFEKKPWFCKPFQTGACQFTKDHETGGRFQKHIYAFCLSQGKQLSHSEKDCYVKRTKNVS